jgi:hypothetical protein
MYCLLMTHAPRIRRARFSMLHCLAALLALFPIVAHAEESLASLLWVLPVMAAAELYFNLLAIYPWLFSGMVIAFFWYSFTGRDLIPFLFDTDTRDGIFGGRDWGFNLHRTLAWATGFSTMYIVLGTVLINPTFMKNLELPQRPGSAASVVRPPAPSSASHCIQRRTVCGRPRRSISSRTSIARRDTRESGSATRKTRRPCT